MGVKTEFNIFITNLSDRLASDRAIFLNSTKHFLPGKCPMTGNTQ